MISWIQRSFQQHFRIVFALLLIGTIISFVMTIGAASGTVGSGHQVATVNFYGHNLAAEMRQLDADAEVSIKLQVGSTGGFNEDQVQRYALQRVAALHLAEERHLPEPTTAEVTDFIKRLGIFAGQNGQFDGQKYAAFRQSLSANPGMSEGDIARVITDDVRIAKVQSLLDGPGYVLPDDVKEQMALSDTVWTIATATVDYASFRPTISPTDSELEKYFSQNSAKYQIPARVLASYVDFPASDYLKNAVVTDAEARAYYDANRSRFPSPKAPPAVKVKPLVPNSDSDYLAVRTQVEDALKFERAKNLALKAASDVAYSIYDAKVPAGSGLDAYLAAHHLTLKPLAPFARDAGPAELGGSSDVAQAAFDLNADRYFSEELPTPTGGAILIWKGVEPAHPPFLAEVRAKVLADYLENERRERFVELGRTLHSQIASRLKAGETFAKAAAAAAAAASVQAEIKTFPAFTLQTRPKDLNETAGSALDHLEKGQLSDMAVADDKGYLVYALDKKTPNLSETNPRFAEMRAQLAAYTARLGSGAYLGQMVEQEQKRAESVVK